MMGAPASASNIQQQPQLPQNNQALFNDIQAMTTMNQGGTNENIASDDANGSTCATYLSLIQQYLMMFQLDNAIWLAERCIAEYSQCFDAVYLLALAYYRKGKVKNAWHILERKTSTTYMDPANSDKTLASIHYLSSQCSYELGEYTLGEIALLKGTRKAYKTANTNEHIDDWILKTSPCPIPNGAAGLALLGNICRKSNRRDRAEKYFRMSLQLDPFLFTSFQALCELGVRDLDPSECFGGTGLVRNTHNDTAPTSRKNVAVRQITNSSSLKTPFQNMEMSAATASPGSTVIRNNHHRTLRFETPGLTPIAMYESTAQTPGPILNHSHFDSINSRPNSLVVRRARQVATRQYYPPSPESTPSMTSVTRSMRYLRGLGISETNDSTVVSTTASRSLFTRSSTETRSSVLGRNPAKKTLNSILDGNKTRDNTVTTKPGTTGGKDDFQEEKKTSNDGDFQEILDLLTIAGTVYMSLCQYQCKDALQYIQLLPPRQQSTPWVLQQQGRAFLESGDFQSSQRCLEYMHTIDPSRMQGLELLSTVYWQLKKEMELSNLAQNALDWDMHAPEAHCVVGNCFSLQKDHETALVFFRRSLQLDPDFTYTHTLSGYEYMSNEDYDKAVACFRQALRTDDRHYNAWYGLGAIYHRQEKFDLAEYHFEKAVSLHPNNSVLRCNLGMSQFASGKAYQALDTLTEAFRLDPRNPQARFQRATIYSALHRPEEALIELQAVRDAAPREATVYFALGKVLKRLGRTDEAMKCFLTAMDLDPKDNQLIKSAMDKLDEPDIDEESINGY